MPADPAEGRVLPDHSAARLLSLVDTYGLASLAGMVVRLETENERLREALKFGGHYEDCASCAGPSPCDCGWSAVLPGASDESHAATQVVGTGDVTTELASRLSPAEQSMAAEPCPCTRFACPRCDAPPSREQGDTK